MHGRAQSRSARQSCARYTLPPTAVWSGWAGICPAVAARTDPDEASQRCKQQEQEQGKEAAAAEQRQIKNSKPREPLEAGIFFVVALETISSSTDDPENTASESLSSRSGVGEIGRSVVHLAACD